MVLFDDIVHPGHFARDIKVMSAGLDAGFDDSRAVFVIGTNSGNEHFRRVSKTQEIRLLQL